MLRPRSGRGLVYFFGSCFSVTSGGNSTSVPMPAVFGTRRPGKPLGRPADWELVLCPAAPPSQKPFPLTFSRGLPAICAFYWHLTRTINVVRKEERDGR